MILTVAASWSRQVANRCCGGVSDATSCRTISSPMPRLAPVTTILRAFTDILTENERCQTTYESCARTKLHVESPTRPWRDIGHWWYLHSTLEILTTTITYDHGHITPVQCAFRGDHYEICSLKYGKSYRKKMHFKMTFVENLGSEMIGEQVTRNRSLNATTRYFDKYSGDANI